MAFLCEKFANIEYTISDCNGNKLSSVDLVLERYNQKHVKKNDLLKALDTKITIYKLLTIVTLNYLH